MRDKQDRSRPGKKTKTFQLRKMRLNLSNNVSIVVDGDALNRVRIRFVEGDLDTVGIYQLQVVSTWADGTETTPKPHEFEVVAAWAA